MKKLKTALCLLITVALQTVMNVLGFPVPLIIPFAAAAAFAEPRFGTAFAAGITCGILEGALFGDFSVSVFVAAVYTAGIFNFKSKPIYVNDLIKLPVWAFLWFFSEYILSAVFNGKAFGIIIYLFPKTALVSAAGVALSAVMYIWLKKTIYKNNYKTFTV